MAILEAKNLNKRFKISRRKIDIILHPFKNTYKDVLNEINFCIDTNGIYSLVGPNGSGKSTLLRILCGILMPDTGSVKINNSPISINPEKVFLISDSEKGFYPRLSLINNLQFFSSLIENSKPGQEINIESLLEEFGLKEERDTRFQELSSGTRQRLAIARAMLFDPQIILFDEITKGVDIKQQQIIYELLYRLKNSGKTIIFATHIMDEIINLSDKIILINDGRLIGFSTYSEIKEHIKQVFDIK